MEMLLIKDVQVCRVPDRETFYQYMEDSPVPRDYVPVDGGKDVMPIKIYRELVRGRVFVNRNKQKVCIGMTNEAGEILGLEYEAWENMNRSLDAVRHEVSDLRTKLSQAQTTLTRIHNGSWWVRLKWLFTGVR